GTITLAMVTSICGSSSRGVTRVAARPSNRPARASTGVSGLAWKARARRPDRPRRGSAIAALSGQVGQGRQRIGSDALALGQAGDHLHPVIHLVAQAHLAQADPVVLADHVDGGDLAAP